MRLQRNSAALAGAALAGAALAGLAVLAMPALASAQAIGEVTVPNDQDIYLNALDCEQAQARTIDLRWWVTVPNGTLSNGIYRVFSSNTAPTTSTSGLKLCETENDTTNDVYAGQVGADVSAGPVDTVRTETFDAWRFPLTANKPCTELPDRTIYVCVHFHPFTSGSTPAAEPTGYATGTLVLSTGKPSTPGSVSLDVGDTRLYVSWKAGSGGIASTQKYEMVATPIGEVGLPDGQRPGERSATSTDTNGKVEGLVNDQDYEVVVYALSPSGTRSAGSAPVVGAPSAVLDFWQIYVDQGGAEKGGCGGPVGPLALLGLAAAMALARARRRS